MMEKLYKTCKWTDSQCLAKKNDYRNTLALQQEVKSEKLSLFAKI